MRNESAVERPVYPQADHHDVGLQVIGERRL